MALALSPFNAVTLEAGIAHLFIESGPFSFFASLQPPKGSPLLELSKHERGTGRRLILGPLMIDASLT
jgi:hypothetical protein